MSDEVKIRLKNADGEVVAEGDDVVQAPRRSSGAAAGRSPWATASGGYPFLSRPNVSEDSVPERRPWMGKFNSLGGRPPESYD
jgi:hypothetical protein